MRNLSIMTGFELIDLIAENMHRLNLISIINFNIYKFILCSINIRNTNYK